MQFNLLTIYPIYAIIQTRAENPLEGFEKCLRICLKTREGGKEMRLNDKDTEKLIVYVAGILAQERKDRGVKLNYPESVALITKNILEYARDGKSVAELMQLGTKLLTKADVMDGVADMVAVVQVECTFPDGTKLVSVHNPIQ